MNELIKNKKILMFIVTLQEAFTAIVPFFLLTASITLLYNLITYLHIDYWIFNKTNILYLSKTLQSFTSLISVIAISYFFAARIKTSQIIAVILSVCVFITITLTENPSAHIELPFGFTPATLIFPLVSTYLLKLFYPKLTLNIKRADGNYHIYKLFNYLFVFFFAYIASVLIYVMLDEIMDGMIERYNPLQSNLPKIIILIIRDFLVQVLWFIGIHGSHTVNGLFGKTILFQEMLPNLTYGEFNRLFALLGGAGVGLGLLISLYVYIKDKALKTITKISTPFVFFNINTLLIYAVVVFNRYFIIPFIFLPIFNIMAAYLFLNFVHIDFTQYNVIWTTPVFVDVYLKTDGNIAAIIFQTALLLIDTLVYLYFTKQFVSSQSFATHIDILEHNLEIPTEIKSKESIYAFKAHKQLIAAQAKLDGVINSLNKENLKIYYQPKINIKKHNCTKFEALIRYNNNGRITGPTFLSVIEEAGLAPVIDIWVCKQVKEHLLKWKAESFFPEISVNLHPDTLRSKDAVSKIIEILKNENIMFEIIERSFLEGKTAQENVYRLQKENFKIAIDDFGTGYSSLEIITRFKIDELKIDKSLIDILDTRKGFVVCKHTINLCHEIGCEVVAEGVETEFQLNSIKSINIDYIQGFYFSEALPFNKIHPFCINFN